MKKVKKPKICPECGEVCTGRSRNTFCSRICANEYQKNHPEMYCTQENHDLKIQKLTKIFSTLKPFELYKVEDWKIGFKFFPIKCPDCSGVFDKRYVYFDKHQGKSMSCDLCGYFLKYLRQPPTFCNYCNKELEGKNRLSEKFCSKACYHNHLISSPEVVLINNSVTVEDNIKFQKSTVLKKWINGKNLIGSLSPIIKKYLIAEADYKCSECSFSGSNPVTGNSILQIDHKDGNALNQTPDNLRVLCPNCHSKTPNFCFLNKGKGKAVRTRELLKSKHNP